MPNQQSRLVPAALILSSLLTAFLPGMASAEENLSNPVPATHAVPPPPPPGITQFLGAQYGMFGQQWGMGAGLPGGSLPPPGLRVKPGENFDSEIYRESMQAALERARKLARTQAPQSTRADAATHLQWLKLNQEQTRLQLDELVMQQDRMLDMLQKRHVAYQTLETEYRTLRAERDQLLDTRRAAGEQEFQVDFVNKRLETLKQKFDIQQAALAEARKIAGTEHIKATMLNDLQQQIQSLTGKHTTLQQNLSHGQDENKTLTRQMEAASQQIAQLEGALKEAESGLQQSQAREAELEQSLAEAHQSGQTALQQAQATHAEVDAERERVAQLLSSSTQEKETLQQELAASRTQLTDLQAVLETVKAESAACMDIQKEKDDTAATQAQALEQLKATLEEREVSLLAANNEISSIKDENRKIAEALIAAQNAAGEQETARSALQAELDQSNVTLQEKETVLATLQGSGQEPLTALHQEREQLKATLREKASRLRAQNENAQAMSQESQRLNEQLLALQNSGKAAEEIQTSLQQELEQLKAGLGEKETALLAAQNSGKESEAAQAKLREELETLKTDLKNKTGALAQAEAHANALQTEIAGLKEQLEASQDKLTAQQTRLTNLRGDLAVLQKERNALKDMTTDSDDDGVSDALDNCPGTVANAVVDENGCELDNDGDGVVESQDLCLDSPAGAEVDQVGCHTGATINLDGVNFMSGTADLTGDSLTELDRIAEVINSVQDFSLEIAGHTDSTGPREHNIALSTLRAEAVRNYLTEKGVSSDRLTAKGYGPDEPVASNQTPEGRAANRRVELRRQ